MPFTWTINPYRGCEFACKYCYARYTHEFMELSDAEFEQKIYVKQQAAWLLRQEMKRVQPGEEIAIGTATDPYQPAEKHFEVTRALLAVLAEQEDRDLGIVTKSNLVLRDLDLLQRIARRNRLSVNLTVTTVDAQLARILEPRAPRPDLRLQAVGKLVEAGIPAGVIVAPVIPGITDLPRDLEAVVRATAEAGGRYIFANALFLKPCSAAIFLPFLAEEFPSSCGGLPPPLCRPRLREPGLQQAHFGMDGHPAQEARLRPRVQLAQPEHASAAAGSGADEALRIVSTAKVNVWLHDFQLSSRTASAVKDLLFPPNACSSANKSRFLASLVMTIPRQRVQSNPPTGLSLCSDQ